MGYRVLVVDDSKLARMAVAKALTRHPSGLGPGRGRQCRRSSGARSGRTAFDLAILDFNMPGRDGLHLAAELLPLKPGMPLAVISANHQVEVVTRAREVGATFLQKPLTEKAMSDFLADAAKRLTTAAR